MTGVRRTLGIALAATIGVSQLFAQNGGSLVGRITDSLRAPISGADVSLRGTRFHTTSSDSGLYRLKVPAGFHHVTIRHVGYPVIDDTVRVEDGIITARDFAFATRLTVLDTLVITKPLSAHMRAFEDRRKTRQGAYITSADLRKMDERPMRSVLMKRLPGVTIVSYRGGSYVKSARGTMSIDPRMRIRALATDPRSPTGCWVQVYLDGSSIYQPHGRSDAVNLEEFQTRDVEAIEYYSGASTPPEFSTSFSGCGTLVLWTRLP